MATRPPVRLTLRGVPDKTLVDGAWWPQSRRLDDELPRLFALWPSATGRIVRVLYSPPDWDDQPRSVAVADGRIKTGCFPQDDTRVLVLSMLDGRKLTLGIVPADTPEDLAVRLLEDGGAPVPAPSTQAVPA